jgi:hypothetical protein
MICAIYERRPHSTRRITTDSRSARLIGQIEFDAKPRHHENVNEIKSILKEQKYKLAATPSKIVHPEYDFVVYVEPDPSASPRERHEANRKVITRKKPVAVGSASGVSRKLPLAKSRKR